MRSSNCNMYQARIVYSTLLQSFKNSARSELCSAGHKIQKIQRLWALQFISSMIRRPRANFCFCIKSNAIVFLQIVFWRWLLAEVNFVTKENNTKETTRRKIYMLRRLNRHLSHFSCLQLPMIQASLKFSAYQANKLDSSPMGKIHLPSKVRTNCIEAKFRFNN